MSLNAVIDDNVIYEIGIMIHIVKNQKNILALTSIFSCIVEKAVKRYIQKGSPIKSKTIKNPEWTLKDDKTLKEKLADEFNEKLVITMPDETYPKEVTVIESEGNDICFEKVLYIIKNSNFFLS